MKKFITLLVLLQCTSFSYSQDGGVIPFSSDRWDLKGDSYEIKEIDGQETLLFKAGKEVPRVILTDANFTNGQISYEVKFDEIRTFLGCYFRMQDLSNYEDFYVRPHQSGNPDAMQYTPVYNALAAWQLYHDDGYATAKAYNYGEWIKISILVSGTQAEVYFDDEENPTLFIPHLHREVQAGMIGLWGGVGMFRNFAYKANDNMTLKSKGVKKDAMPAGTVTNWFVLPETYTKTQAEGLIKSKNQLNWQSIKTDAEGRLNVSRVLPPPGEKNTALLKFNISSETEQTKQIDFGFSDRVTIYVNGQPIYSGNNTYRSRDYRFLGSIGYFDSFYAPLKKGQNEVIFVLSEAFGGWGAMAKFTN